jgi:hypothetical protein
MSVPSSGKMLTPMLGVMMSWKLSTWYGPLRLVRIFVAT